VALLGAGLATVALGLLACDLSGERAGLVLGTVFTIKIVAYVGIAPVAGAFAPAGRVAPCSSASIWCARPWRFACCSSPRSGRSMS
jgi:hypothetical protein